MMGKKKFKTCATCPSPAACTRAGKCAKASAKPAMAKGGMAKKPVQMAKGGMAKKGYAEGGVVKANCGASVPPNRKAKK